MGASQDGAGIELSIDRRLRAMAMTEPQGKVIRRLHRAGSVSAEGRPIDPSTRPNSVRILAVGDDSDLMHAMGGAITELGHAFTVAGDGESGLAATLDDRPDVILCDVALKGMTGLQLLERITVASPTTARVPFVFLAAQMDRDGELAGRRAGAVQYLTKPVDLELLQAMVTNIAHSLSSGPVPPNPLTMREREALTWAGRGKTSSEIGVILDISERTVNFHCDQAMKRLDVVNRTQAVARAITAGIIAP